MLSDGRVIGGKEAVDLKLVDQLGTFNDAVQIAKEKANITDEAELVYLSRKPKGFMERFLEGSIGPVRQWVQSKLNILEYRFDPSQLR
jgi:protease-4